MNFRSDAPPAPPAVQQKTLKYKQADEHLVRRLGQALVMQWDALSDDLQDLIIDQAAAVEDREALPLSEGEIENFIRTAKTVALTKAADGDAK